MPRTEKPSIAINNRLLSTLPDNEYQKLLPFLETIELPQGKVIYEPDQVIRYVLFPNDAAVSLLSLTSEGETVEVGLIGYEGMVGISIILGAESTPYRAMVQIQGSGNIVKATLLKQVIKQSEILNSLLVHYTHALRTQISQSAVCNRFHTVEARLSRWLLDTHDRVKSKTLSYTQELLAHMLGASRSDVTRAARLFQDSGIISYSRGQITILDRKELEVSSCECYHIVKNEFDKFLGV